MERTGSVALVSIMVSLLLLSCSSTPFSRYRYEMFQGRQFYEDTDYVSARAAFLRASADERTAASLAWAAVACYRMNELDLAERLINEARSVDRDGVPSLRIRGYKALILLSAGRTREGLEALRDYVDLYRRLDPLMTVGEVDRMARGGQIDLKRLDHLIGEQVDQYENDIQQVYNTGTGYYGQKWETRTGMSPLSW